LLQLVIASRINVDATVILKLNYYNVAEVMLIFLFKKESAKLKPALM